MCTLYNKNYITAIPAYLDTYLKNKPADCVLYSEDGTEFKIRKELLSQTKFLRKILSSAKDHCCNIIEILCPCSKEELGRLVEFLYHGKIICDRKNGSFHILENLTKIFGFPNFQFDLPENFTCDDEIETLISDHSLSTSIEIEEFAIKEEPIEKASSDSNADFLEKRSKVCDKKLNSTSQNDYIEQHEEVEDETKENINDSNSNRISKIRFKARDNISIKKKRRSTSRGGLQNQSENDQECPHCSKKINGHGYHLKRHIQSVHEKISTFTCDKCQKQFRDSYALKLHIDMVHEKIRKFNCPICQKFFATKQKLNIHQTKPHKTVSKIKVKRMAKIAGANTGAKVSPNPDPAMIVPATQADQKGPADGKPKEETFSPVPLAPAAKAPAEVKSTRAGRKRKNPTASAPE